MDSEHGYGKEKKIPAIQSLKEEYAILDKEKRGLYKGYGKQRDDVIALKLARQHQQAKKSPEPRQRIWRFWAGCAQVALLAIITQDS